MSTGLFKLYQELLIRRPCLVQAIQTGLLMGTGVLISQTLIEKKNISNVDYMRTIKFSSIGFFVAGPALHVWYGVLNKHVGSSGKTVAVKKVFFDQVTFAPIFLLIILTLGTAMQDKKWYDVKSDLQRNYFAVLKTNYCVWPWVQLVNFYLVPFNYQVLVAQTFGLFWNTYLSWRINKKKVADD